MTRQPPRISSNKSRCNNSNNKNSNNSNNSKRKSRRKRRRRRRRRQKRQPPKRSSKSSPRPRRPVSRSHPSVINSPLPPSQQQQLSPHNSNPISQLRRLPPPLFLKARRSQSSQLPPNENQYRSSSIRQTSKTAVMIVVSVPPLRLSKHQGHSSLFVRIWRGLLSRFATHCRLQLYLVYQYRLLDQRALPCVSNLKF